MVEAFLLREDKESASDIDEIQREDEEDKPEEGLFCRHCGHQITSAKFSIEVDGSHNHTFFNPAGIIYEIRCFSKAAGCLNQGPASSEFAWFAGYTWQIATCSLCTVHLGWYFSSGESSFFGLIAKNLSS